MKKALVILFALGLVFAFTAPVMATDVSFDGSYRVRGWYDSNSALAKESTSSAYYDQRFRLQGVFQVAEGLSVTVRGDVLDGTWGTTAMRGPTGTVSTTGTADLVTGAVTSTGTSTIPTNNVQFDYAYMTFMTGIGQFKAGYMADGLWGTGFGDLWATRGTVSFMTKLGENLGLLVKTCKVVEGDKGNTNSDLDDDTYVAALIYGGEGINAGLLYKRFRYANMASGATAVALSGNPLGYDDITLNAVVPYVKATFGDFYVESELTWADGKAKAFSGGTDLDLEGLSFYLMGKYNIGAAYVGGFFAYVQGDDPKTAANKKSENALGLVNSGGDWDPMLILFNDTCPTSLGTAAIAQTGTSMTNGYLYQAFAGTAIDKLSLKASLSYAKADEKPTSYVDDEYGTEFDVTAAYKIYDNLTYSAGFGYLWAGDYYKGTGATNKIDDTYLLMNKLQVNF